MLKTKEIVVLGGGLSGLTTAWKLATQGHKVTIIEADKKVGGLAKSYKKEGCIFDYGPHAFHMKNRIVFSELRTILGNELDCIGKKKITVYFNKKTFDDPLRNTYAVLNLGPTKLVKCALSYAYSNLKLKIGKPKDDTFEDWLSNRFGKEFYDIFFGSYTRKVWNMDPKELDYKFASERIAPLQIKKLFSTVLLNKKEAVKTADLNEGDLDPSVMYYPNKGIGQLSDMLKEEIEKHGGLVFLNTKPTSIEIEKDVAKKVRIEGGKTGTITCDHVVSTIPLDQLATLINPSLEEDVLESVKELKFRGALFLFLTVKKDKLFDDHWLYFQDEDIIFYRANQNTIFSKALMPKGRCGLILEMGERYFEEDKDRVLEAALDALEKNRILKKEDVETHYFDTLSHAYPIYRKNVDVHVKKVLERIQNITNLTTIGRQGLFRYLDMHHCIQMGILVANQINSGYKNPEEINLMFAKGGAEGV